MNRLVRTELLKQRTTRTLVAGLAAAPVIAALLTIAILSAAGKHGNDPLGPDNLVQVLGAPAGVITLIAILVGVVGTAGEYRHQTITTTLLASPRRRDVVTAKLAAHAITGAVMAMLSLTVSTETSSRMFDCVRWNGRRPATRSSITRLRSISL